MKHLNKFNEEKNSYKDLHEYIKLCFIDFIDVDPSTLEDFEDEYSTDYDDITVGVNMPWTGHKGGKWFFNKPKDIEDMIKYAEELTEHYKIIESCIERVKMKFDVVVDMYYEHEKGKIRNTAIEGIFDAYLQIIFRLV